MQALNAWLAGHDAGVLLEGPDPDSGRPLLNGVVVAQQPSAHAWLNRWDVVTVWVRIDPGDLSGVREPRRPLPPIIAAEADLDEAGGIT